MVMSSEEVKASEKIAKRKWQQKHKKEIANYRRLRRMGQTPSQLKQKKIMDKKIGVGDNRVRDDRVIDNGVRDDGVIDNGVRDDGVIDNRVIDNGVIDNSKIITISGKTKNLEILMKTLAFPKGGDLLFPFRKIVIQKKSNEEKPRLVARQLAGAGSIYSQVFIKPDGTVPFLNIEGEGDLTLDMKKALKDIKNLKMSKCKEAYITYNIESHEIVFGSIENGIEFKTREPISAEIDDASGVVGVPCDCNQNPACPLCNGRGVKPSPALSYKNGIVLCAPDSSMYANPDVKLELDSKVMQNIGNEAFNFSDIFPIQFTKDSLTVLISDPNDITKDSFKKVIPVTYAVNNMVDKQIWLGNGYGDYYKHIFNNLTEKITLWSANLPPEEESIYVSMNKPGGFHCGVQIQAKCRC